MGSSLTAPRCTGLGNIRERLGRIVHVRCLSADFRGRVGRTVHVLCLSQAFGPVQRRGSGTIGIVLHLVTDFGRRRGRIRTVLHVFSESS